MTQSQNSNDTKEERKLEPYHYEAMIRAEVEKRLAEEKKAQTNSQPNYPPAYYESPPPHLAQQQPTGFLNPTQQYYPPQTPQPQQYQSGPLPYQQPYQQQPQPYYPPPAPVVNVIVQNTNVNQNVHGYYGRRYYRKQTDSGLANVVYFLLIGWCLGLSWAFVGICVLPFSRSASNEIFKQAVFLAFLK